MTIETESDIVHQRQLVPLPAYLNEHIDFWQSGHPSLKDIALDLPDKCIDELDSALTSASSDSVVVAGTEHGLAACQQFIQQVRHRLNKTSGCVIINRFPVERYSEQDNRRLCATFATLLAPLMEQDYHGTLIYDVKDKKEIKTGKVRRSITNLAQPYHSDGPWYNPTARYIGLYCIHSAQQGGNSHIASMAATYHTLYHTADQPTLETLTSPLPWDRQGEHAISDKTYVELPIFESSDTTFSARYYESYILNGFKEIGRSVDEQTHQALAALRNALAAQKSIEFLLEPGQFQILNNRIVLHARDEFQDSQEFDSNSQSRPQQKRQLVRLWNS